MEVKEVKIVVPEGYEVDKENSTFECIKFKPKKLTYKDVAVALFSGKTVYYPATLSGIGSTTMSPRDEFIADSNNAGSVEQVKKLLALNKLINVAKYLNGDWKPKFDNSEDTFILITSGDEIHTEKCRYWNLGVPCFKSEELALQAVEILGEETIKLALSQV